jgi:L-fucose isomerase
VPLPICDMAESLLNSTFDHNGRKPALPFATEADAQGLLTMLFKTWLSGGNPPLFMDFRKVWEAPELCELARKQGLEPKAKDVWAQRGIVDGDNSGSASLDWAGKPGDSPEASMKNVSMPGAELYYFPGGGNSVTFITPGGINGIASRLAYSDLAGMFSLVWDEAFTVDLPAKLASAVAGLSNPTWPHTWVTPKYATMAEYKQYAPANPPRPWHSLRLPATLHFTAAICRRSHLTHRAPTPTRATPPTRASPPTAPRPSRARRPNPIPPSPPPTSLRWMLR